jgi:hypothetical protein
MNRVLMTVAILISLCGVPILAAAPNTNQLQPETVKAWDEYVRTVDSRFGVRSSGGVPFLWIDESNQRARRIGQGEILVAPVLPHGTQTVPSGLIHHWIGGVFVPGATIGSLSAVVRDYSKYKDIYKPVVVDSKVLGCTDDDQRFIRTMVN